MTEDLSRTVRLVAALNLAYFGVEFAVALAIGSVSLFADSMDFLEDASVNFLIFAALGWTAKRRARVGMLLAGILLVPGLAALWMAWEKFMAPVAPNPVPLSLAGVGAMAVNFVCAMMLGRYRHRGRSLAKAAFLSARNDGLANVAIVAAGSVTAFLWRSAWPDLIAGLGIATLNADAAQEVCEAARREHRAVAWTKMRRARLTRVNGHPKARPGLGTRSRAPCEASQRRRFTAPCRADAGRLVVKEKPGRAGLRRPGQRPDWEEMPRRGTPRARTEAGTRPAEQGGFRATADDPQVRGPRSKPLCRLRATTWEPEH